MVFRGLRDMRSWSRLNAEADVRRRLFSAKPHVTEICRNVKTKPVFSLSFCFGKRAYFSLNAMCITLRDEILIFFQFYSLMQ